MSGGHGQFNFRIMISSGEVAAARNWLQRNDIGTRGLAAEIEKVNQQAEAIPRAGGRGTGRTLGGAARRATARRRRGASRFAQLRRILRARGSRNQDGLFANTTKPSAPSRRAMRRRCLTLPATGSFLVNAPVACERPAHRAGSGREESTSQVAVQSLAAKWCASGHTMGFGVGIAMGPVTVGTVGYEGRLDYTAVGDAVEPGVPTVRAREGCTDPRRPHGPPKA